MFTCIYAPYSASHYADFTDKSPLYLACNTRTELCLLEREGGTSKVRHENTAGGVTWPLTK